MYADRIVTTEKVYDKQEVKLIACTNERSYLETNVGKNKLLYVKKEELLKAARKR